MITSKISPVSSLVITIFIYDIMTFMPHFLDDKTCAKQPLSTLVNIVDKLGIMDFS